jgi:glycosyltransferase involved in cell wall biosynthesis
LTRHGLTETVRKKLRVVVTAAQCGRAGSVAAVAVRQAGELARRHEVTLISDSLPSALPADVVGFRVEPLKFDVLRRFAHVPNEWAFCRAVRSALVRRSLQEDIDFVVCHSHALCAFAAVPLRLGGRPKIALVTHGDVRFRPKGTYDARLTAFYRAATGPAYTGADLVVALSPVMAERAVSGGADSQKIVVLPNGLDPEEIGLDDPVVHDREGREDETGTTRREPLRILYVGRLSVEKGIGVLLDAAALLARTAARVRITMIGDGPLRGAAHRAAADPSLSGLLEVSCPVERRRLSGFYRSTDVLCVPSLDEPLGLVVLEALSCGTPVVGSNVGGIPFLVRDGVDGLLVNAGDAPALAEALAKLAEDSAALRRLRENARAGAKAVSERFSWRAIGESLASAIEKTCA